MSEDSPRGYGAIVSTVTAMIALLSAIHPDWLKLVALSNHSHELTQILTTLAGGVATVGAALSHPPAWLRAPWDDLKFWITARFRKPSA